MKERGPVVRPLKELVAEFKEALGTEPLDDIASGRILAGMPYVFRGKPDLSQRFVDVLSARLNVKPGAVAVVGSAKMGFSLNPDTPFRPFWDSSDIDVVVVSEAMFDRLWMALIEWYYPYRFDKKALPASVRRWAGELRRSAFFGWFEPKQLPYDGLSRPPVLRPLSEFSGWWFDAFQGMALAPEFASRRVEGRLFRTRPHAVRYYAEGLRLVAPRDQTFVSERME